MATKTIRLDEAVYARIKARKREGESFSDVIARLASDYSLLDFAGGYSTDDADRHRGLLAGSDETTKADHRELLDRMDAGE